MTSTRTRRLGIGLVAALALPAALGALAVASVGDRVDGLRHLPAAVVNLDEPVTLGKGKDAQVIAGGRLMAAGLTSPSASQDAGLDWELATATTAEEGLADGTYRAVVTIPADFSETLATVTSTSPQQAGVTIRTEGADGDVVGAVTSDVGEVAAARLGRTITTSYLAGMYAQTSALGEQLGDAADGAAQLADGASSLTGGATQLGEGAAQLTEGVSTLGSGADRLSEGATQLDAGTGDLAAGLDQLRDGTGRLSSGTADLSDGAGTLSDGLGTLASGAQELSGGTASLASGARDLDGGAATLSEGLATLATQTSALPTQTRQIADGAASVRTGVDGWAQVLGAWAQACADPVLAGAAAPLCSATQQAVGPDGSTATQLTAGAAALAQGTSQLADATPTLVEGISSAAGGAQALHEGTTELSGGAAALASGAADLSTGADDAHSGARSLAKGSTTLARGADRVARGTRSAARGAGRLTRGSASLAQGADELANGTTRLVDGAGRLSEATGQLADGSRRLTTGGRELADGLDEGAAALPSTSAAEQQANAETVAQPVTSEVVDQAPTDGRHSIAPSALTLALWLGALATFLIVPALSPTRLRAATTARRTALAGLGGGLAIGVGQGLLVLGAVALLDLSQSHPLALSLAVIPALVAAFTSLAQALLAWFGTRTGTLAVLALTALQLLTTSGVLPLDLAPGWVGALHAALPVPVASDLVAWAINGSGSASTPMIVLGLWFALGVAVSIGAASRRARVSVAGLRTADARLAAA